MKTNSADRSGFFHLRIVITMVLGSIGLFLALLGLGAMGTGILTFGVADVNLVTGPETSPNVTQASSAAWGHGNTVVVVYDDSSGLPLSPLSICGVSTSTDGGASFTRLPYKFNTGGQCFGFPSLFYSVRAAKWFVSALATRCGGLGIGLWTSPDGITWSNGSCAASTNAADIGSIWVDNNPASPFYGRQYALFSDFNINGGAPRATRSTDDGITWSAPSTLFAGFRRAWKVTGSLGTDGAVYAQTVAEGGGGLGGPRQNFIHRSTDGGATWSAPLSQGATFLGPGRSICSDSGYFACMYSAPGYWRDMGWGEPAAGLGGVVHYAYSTHGVASDPGDIYYIRSTDTGSTWSVPLKLNTDATTRAQWSPSLSVNTAGNVFVSWYDERNTVTDALERFGRASTNNGVTWSADMALSDVIFPKPLQPDPGIQASYVGIFHRSAYSNNGTGGVAYHTWTDGRVAIGGNPQQDVFFDRIGMVSPANVLANGGFYIISAGPNGVLDPGEVVTVSLGARNIGGPGVICTTAALTGTLQATGGVTSPSGPQTYGVLCSGSPSVFRNFTFTVDPALPCGSSVTASLQVQDGATNYGTLTYTFITGSTLTTNVQNFDGVVAPALPAGWTTTFSGLGTAVTTSTIFPDTAPNDIFLSEASNVALSEVTSANIAITGAAQKLTFRNLYNTEPGFDGLVLEIKIGAGAFQDILAAGGTFASGGYNATLSTGFQNPLPGRMAWAGLSGGTAAAPTYITSVVNLPAAANGQNIQLRWRMGSDNSVIPATNPGSRIDTIRLVSTVCGGTAPVPTSVVSRKLHPALQFDINMPLSGPSGVECRRGTGASQNNHRLVVTFGGPVTVGGVTVTSNDGLATAAQSVMDNVVTVDLAAVADAQVLAVALNNTSVGGNLGSINIPMGILLGDTNGDRFVNAGDALQTRSRAGQATDATNFRSDVNEDGVVNSGDSIIVRSRSGNALP